MDDVFVALFVCFLFLFVGWLMGRCSYKQVVSPQYPQSLIEKLKPKKKSVQPYENDPYAEAMEDLSKNKGTIEGE